MLGERFVAPGLAHLSFVVACDRTKLAAAVDPGRDLRPILAWVEREGLSLKHVLETHIHADYASGARELALATDSALHLSAYDRGEDFEVAYPHERLEDGAEVSVGDVRLRALHTPGHTPEHMAFVATNAEGPPRLLSGDFLFVGSLGRPDLIGEEAKIGLAKASFASLGRLADLPDETVVHPAHGAGSLCGAGLSHDLSSTLGRERRENPYLDPSLDEAAFVSRLLGDLPPFPPYYRRMKALNSAGAPFLLDRPSPAAMAPAAALAAAASGAAFVDARPPGEFAAGHTARAISLPAGGQMAAWAGWLGPYGTPLVLVAEGQVEATEAAWTLAQVGLDGVAGWVAPDQEEWQAAGGEWRQTEQWAPEQVAAAEGATVVDVRAAGELASGRIPGSVPLYLGDLGERLDGLPGGDPVVFVCGSGPRSLTAASVVERGGGPPAVNLAGGMVAWRAAGLPVAT